MLTIDSSISDSQAELFKTPVNFDWGFLWMFLLKCLYMLCHKWRSDGLQLVSSRLIPRLSFVMLIKSFGSDAIFRKLLASRNA